MVGMETDYRSQIDYGIRRFFPSKKALAERVGMAPSTLTRWIAGDSQMRMDNVQALLDAVRDAEEEWHASRIEHVYFCKFPGLPFIKIGHSNNVKNRIINLNKQFPLELELLASFEGRRAHETRVHAYFERLYVRGEWFKESPEIWAMIEDIRNEEFDINSIPAPDSRAQIHLRVRRRQSDGTIQQEAADRPE